MVVGIRRRAVGIFSHRRDAEDALHELKRSGFAMDRVSVMAKDADGRDNIAGTEIREDVGNKADEGASVGALSGGALGGLTGLLVGLGTLAIPGIGPIMLAGATATTLATTLAGAGIGALTGSLLGGLIGLGIPEERAKVYNDRVERGHYLVIIEGTDDEIGHAEHVLRRHNIEEFEIYNHPDDRAVARTSDMNYVGSGYVNTAPMSVTQRRAIGVFHRRLDAEAAITDLRDAGFSMSDVSLIGKNADGNSNVTGVDNRFGGNKADEGAAAGAATGGVLGGLGGLLVGLGALAIPGVGPVIVGGAAATALATALTGGAIGAAAGGIAGGLAGLGIPENRAKVYNDRFQRGDYLVIVDGTEDEIRRAEAILKRRGIQEFDVFDAPRNEAVPLQGNAINNTPVVHDNPVIHHSGDAPVVIIDRRDESAKY
jgi:hypothetical protein